MPGPSPNTGMASRLLDRGVVDAVPLAWNQPWIAPRHFHFIHTTLKVTTLSRKTCSNNTPAPAVSPPTLIPSTTDLGLDVRRKGVWWREVIEAYMPVDYADMNDVWKRKFGQVGPIKHDLGSH